MKGSLYINNVLESADITIPLTFNANELNDLNDKRSGMSGTIILEKNEKYHEDAEIWDDAITCDYYRNGIQLVRSGEVKAVKFTKTEVHLKVYFGAVLLSSLFKELKINELTDATLNVTWDLDTIEDLNCEDDDVFFLFANTDIIGEDNFVLAGGTINAERLIPAIKVRKILELIETETGVTLSGDFADDILIDNLCMPLISNAPLEEVITGSKVMVYANDYLLQSLQHRGGIYFNLSKIDIFQAATGYAVIASDKLKITKDGIYDINLKGILNWGLDFLKNRTTPESVTVEVEGQVLLYKNLSNILAYNFNESYTTAQPNWRRDVNYDLSTKDLALVVGDVIFVKYSFNISGTLAHDGLFYLALKSQFDFSAETSPVQFGSTAINTLSLLPKITALDFLKSLIQKKGFLLDYDLINEDFELNYFNKLNDNKLISEKWSNRYVSHEITDIYGVVGKNNLFRYSNDKNLEADFGGGSFEIDKEALPGESLILKDITSATAQENFSEFSNDFDICRIPLISEKKREWEKLKARFLLVEKKDVTTITIEKTSTKNLTTVNRAWFMSGDNWNIDYQFIIDNYYEDYISMMEKYRKYNIKVILNERDCLKSQFKLVYFEQLQKYIFIEKINFSSETKQATIEGVQI